MSNRKKFEKRTPKQLWTLERTYQRRSLVDKEIADLNRKMNSIDRYVRYLTETLKPLLQKKVANKWRYRRQLEQQIQEIRERDGQAKVN